MKLLDFNVRLSVNVLNLRRPLSIVIRSASLFGVGGSGRSPVSLHESGVLKVLWSVVLLCVGTTMSGAVASGAMVSCVMVSGLYGE